MGFEPCVAECAARVEPFQQVDKVGMAFVERSDRRRVRMEDLTPVWSCLEWGQDVLYLDNHLLNCVWLALPGEVNTNAVFLVARTHPQPIGGHPTKLTHEQEGTYSVCKGAQRFYSWGDVPSGDEIFRLDFLAAAGRVPHAKMR